MSDVKRKHLLSIQDLSPDEIPFLLNKAQQLKILFRDERKLSNLRGKTVVQLFFEPSTRTRSSFEIAAKRLGADTIHLSATSSSAVKGETLIDTARNIEAMNPDLIILRHYSSGAPYALSKYLHTPLVNAGDGFHEHPTQALLDLMTIWEKKPHFSDLKVLIVGDIAHSRVARSNIALLHMLSAQVEVCAPPTLLPPRAEQLGVKCHYSLREAIEGKDVIMMLRIQSERQLPHQFPSLREYSKYFGLNSDTLKYAKPDIMIMHPGPMNRGVEISPDVADGPFSVILNQVTNGVAIRAALMEYFINGGNHDYS